MPNLFCIIYAHHTPNTYHVNTANSRAITGHFPSYPGHYSLGVQWDLNPLERWWRDVVAFWGKGGLGLSTLVWYRHGQSTSSLTALVDWLSCHPEYFISCVASLSLSLYLSIFLGGGLLFFAVFLCCEFWFVFTRSFPFSRKKGQKRNQISAPDFVSLVVCVSLLLFLETMNIYPIYISWEVVCRSFLCVLTSPFS